MDRTLKAALAPVPLATVVIASIWAPWILRVAAWCIGIIVFCYLCMALREKPQAE